MRILGRHYRSIWIDDATQLPRIIDQTLLPHRVETLLLPDLAAVAEAIQTMRVRGAPLIGATAAHGLANALAADASDGNLAASVQQLVATRPTAVNLQWAVERVRCAVATLDPPERAGRAREEANSICDEDVETCEAIGANGLSLIESISNKKRGEPVDILTHCNAGWLATVDWGTALAPIYKAHDAGLAVHVWVDETRPRNQGSGLTAFELREHGVPHTVIVDNAGGHLMQHGRVDAVVVGSDRTTAAGDVCNKIGTYLKALAAAANDVPFFVCLPSSTIDWASRDGIADIPIEARDPDEVRFITGRSSKGEIVTIDTFGGDTQAQNPAFDVTPASLVTRLVTEKGVFSATHESLTELRQILDAPALAGR